MNCKNIWFYGKQEVLESTAASMQNIWKAIASPCAAAAAAFGTFAHYKAMYDYAECNEKLNN